MCIVNIDSPIVFYSKLNCLTSGPYVNGISFAMQQGNHRETNQLHFHGLLYQCKVTKQTQDTIGLLQRQWRLRLATRDQTETQVENSLARQMAKNIQYMKNKGIYI